MGLDEKPVPPRWGERVRRFDVCGQGARAALQHPRGPLLGKKYRVKTTVFWLLITLLVFKMRFFFLLFLSEFFWVFLLATSSKPEAFDRASGDAVCVEIGMVPMQPGKLELVLHRSTSGWVEKLL